MAKQSGGGGASGQDKWHVETARDMQKRRYYHGVLPDADARGMLQRDGDFVVRQAPAGADAPLALANGAAAEPGAFVITVRWGTASDEHTPQLLNVAVRRHRSGKFHVGTNKKYDSVADVVGELVESKSPLPTGVKGGVEPQLVRPIELEPWELRHCDIKTVKTIGSGSFGRVWKGQLRVAGQWINVAIKEHLQLDEPGADTELIEMLREARTLRELCHENLVKYYGIAIREEPMYLVMELVADGDVGTFMRRRAKAISGRPVSKAFRVSMLLDAARGLAYMHALTPPCLHRDIASRNALIDESKRLVKLTDFGLTRRGEYYRQSKDKQGMPLRWSAPEVIETMKWDVESDVYSFAVLMWEVFSSCLAQPYQKMSGAEVARHVRRGGRERTPTAMPKQVVAILDGCWAQAASDRPTMKAVVDRLTAIYQIMVGGDTTAATATVDDAPTVDNTAPGEQDDLLATPIQPAAGGAQNQQPGPAAATKQPAAASGRRAPARAKVTVQAAGKGDKRAGGRRRTSSSKSTRRSSRRSRSQRSVAKRGGRATRSRGSSKRSRSRGSR